MSFPNLFKTITNWVKKSYFVSRLLVLLAEPHKVLRKDYLDAYEVCWLVNACVDRIAEAVANVELTLYEIDRRNGNISEAKEDHPFIQLLNQVNPFMTKAELFEITVTYLQLLGNAYWLKLRAEDGKRIVALWPLRADWVRPHYHPERIIDYYEYRQPGIFEKFKAEDIIHFRQVNPQDPFYGLGTTQPIIETIKTLIFATRWNMNFFYNSARPDALLITKARLTPEEKAELKRQWYKEVGGWEGAHRLGILEGEAEYKPINYTIRDMDFAKLHDVAVNDILAAFGVPKPVLAMTTDLNRATADAAIYIFFRNTIKPIVQKMIEKMNEFLVPEFGDNLFLDFVDPVPEDRSAILAEYESALRNNWMVINEVRDKENLPPIEGGWNIYMPAMSIPVGELPEEERRQRIIIGKVNPNDYYKKKEELKQKTLRKKILPKMKTFLLKNELKKELVKFIQNKKKIQFTTEQKNKLWLEHDKTLITDEKIFMAMVRRLFKKQRDRVLEAFRSKFTGLANFEEIITKARWDLPIDWNIENLIFVEISKPVFNEIIMRRGKRVYDLLGEEEFEMTEKIRNFIERKTMKFADQVNTTTRERIKEAIKEGLKEEEGIDQIAKRIEEVFTQRTKADTIRIARTEVLSASNEATLEAYDQSGIVERKEWLATRDARTRDTHLAVDGEVRELHEKFSNGLMYPGDPAGDAEEVVNCRCTLIPHLE